MRARGRYICDKCGLECHPAHVNVVSVSTLDSHDLCSVRLEWHLCDKCIEVVEESVAYDILEPR